MIVPPEDGNDGDNDGDSDDESDYEYSYSDEEDCHISFLRSDPILTESSSGMNVKQQQQPDDNATSSSSVAVVPSSSSPKPSNHNHNNKSESDTNNNTSSASSNKRKSTWKEPSQAAVSMSLRAEREKSGGKRRLASDLYKIMMGDTVEQGFSLEPASEDSMDKW